MVNKPSGLLVHRGWANDRVVAHPYQTDVGKDIADFRVTGSGRTVRYAHTAATGEDIIPRTRLSGISNIYASPVGADGRVYLTGRNGTTLVLQRTDELNVIATNSVDDQIDSSAALAGRQLFLRGSKFLYCIEE